MALPSTCIFLLFRNTSNFKLAAHNDSNGDKLLGRVQKKTRGCWKCESLFQFLQQWNHRLTHTVEIFTLPTCTFVFFIWWNTILSHYVTIHLLFLLFFFFWFWGWYPSLFWWLVFPFLCFCCRYWFLFQTIKN